MARRKSPNLTEAELRLMNVLWKIGQGTVTDVVDALPPAGPGLAYTTVLTMLRILENKGYVRHTKTGRAFVYQPLVGQKEAGRRAIRHLVARFFGGSPGRLVMNLLEDEKLDSDELRRIRRKIEQSE